MVELGININLSWKGLNEEPNNGLVNVSTICSQCIYNL